MYRVDETACTGCGDCVEACPTGAIAVVDGRARIDEASCTDCGSCADGCPEGAIVRAEVVSPACVAIKSTEDLTIAAASAASGEASSLSHRPEAEVLPAASWRTRLWPMVGGALVWAARELLPEVIATWQASRAGVLQPTNRKAATFGLAALSHRRAGHRHRWGRV